MTWVPYQRDPRPRHICACNCHDNEWWFDDPDFDCDCGLTPLDTVGDDGDVSDGAVDAIAGSGPVGDDRGEPA